MVAVLVVLAGEMLDLPPLLPVKGATNEKARLTQQHAALVAEVAKLQLDVRENAVADFITNLSQSGVFSNVELQESVQRPDNEGSISFEFTLTAEFALPVPPEASADSQAAAAGGS